MENKFIFVTLTFTFVVFFAMTGISIATYQKQVAEVQSLHTKFEDREFEIDRLTVQLVKNNEDIREYKQVIQQYEQKIKDYEKKMNQLQSKVIAQQNSIQEVKSQVNF